MKKIILPAFILLSLAIATPALAQTNCAGGKCTYTPLEPLPCPPGVANCQSGDVQFPVFLSTLFRLLITIGGLFAVVMLVVAGISYMVSESMGDIDKAKNRAKAALWGLLLLASSWLILNAINPKLLQFDLSSIGALSQQTSTQNNSSTPSQPSNVLSQFTLQGDLNSPENKQKFNDFAYQCTNENGGLPSQNGSVLTCSRR